MNISPILTTYINVLTPMLNTEGNIISVTSTMPKQYIIERRTARGSRLYGDTITGFNMNIHCRWIADLFFMIGYQYQRSPIKIIIHGNLHNTVYTVPPEPQHLSVQIETSNRALSPMYHIIPPTIVHYNESMYIEYPGILHQRPGMRGGEIIRKKKNSNRKTKRKSKRNSKGKTKRKTKRKSKKKTKKIERKI